MNDKDKLLCKYFGDDLTVNIKTNKIAKIEDYMYDKYHKEDDDYVQRTEKRRLVTGKTLILNIVAYFTSGILIVLGLLLSITIGYSLYMAYIERYLIHEFLNADPAIADASTISIYSFFGVIFYVIIFVFILYFLYYGVCKLWIYLSEYTIAECKYNKKEKE